MATLEDGGSTAYSVVANGEEQYSIWPAGCELPAGWAAIGLTGSKDVCLAAIARMWTDLRPLSLRQQLTGGPAHHHGSDATAGSALETDIHRLFERHAEKSPGSLALIDGKNRLSYKELNRKANQLGNFLRHVKHVGPEVLVGIALPRSSD